MYLFTFLVLVTIFLCISLIESTLYLLSLRTKEVLEIILQNKPGKCSAVLVINGELLESQATLNC